MDRRRFLAGAAALAAGIAGPFAGVACAGAQGGAGVQARAAPDYGRLRPVRDLRDGEVRLHLPEGFRTARSARRRAFSDGSVMPGGTTGWPRSRAGGTAILVRNHEVNGPVGAFGDPRQGLRPDGRRRHRRPSGHPPRRGARILRRLNGTMMNCSGGPMPWGAWVSCEETVNGPDVGTTSPAATTPR